MSSTMCVLHIRTKAAHWYPSGCSPKPQVRRKKSAFAAGAVAGAVAGLLSGVPSTVHALVTGGDPLAAARAAGNLLLPADARPTALLAAGGLAHVVASLGWGTVLTMAVRRTSLSPLAVGLAGGAAIAAVDLGLLAHGPFGRRWPLIRALPVLPQVADHLAFGAIAGAVLRRRG
jgi:predicted acyltransferase